MLFALTDSTKGVALCLIQIVVLAWTGLEQSSFSNPCVKGTLVVVVHTVPRVVFRLCLLLWAEARAETDEGLCEGGRGRERYWHPQEGAEYDSRV